MWWLDPGKEVLNVLFNRILAPYVMNLDLNQVNYGIGQGQLTLRNLKLKKGALDKFQLPVDVLEGHLGRFTLSLHWMNLGNQPVEILIEDVYLLVIPSPPSNANTGEDEARAYAAKSERLENAELLHVQGEVETQAGGTPQSQGLVQSIIAKVINNVQVTVKNIHIRYEDNLSVPGHPFAAGITLAGFTAVSVNDQWEPAFIESTAGAIHKLAKLQSLALYFDTDSPSMSGLPTAESIKKFAAMISHSKDDTQHQYILKPVSGEGRVIVNHKMDKETPQFDIQLLFEEIGVILDDHQYRDAISLVDMYHVYLRKRQYGKYRPVDDLFISNVSRARLTYAITAIVEGVREKNRKWTWQYFAERRDDRNVYVSLFQKKLLGPLLGADLQRFEELEHRLTYEDIRFYRSIARSKSKKDIALRKKIEADKKEQQSQKQGWGEWLWGSSPTKTDKDESVFTGSMTDEQRQQLYDVLDYDEKAAVVNAIQGSRESLKMRIAAKLNKGSFALKTDPHKENIEVMSIVFDVFQANLIQRPNNFEASISLNGFRVFDGTTSNTLYPQIVHVKAEHDGEQNTSDSLREEETSPFFFVKFENNPLDERADNALTVRMRHMEIIYHKGYVEAVYKFFKPPSSQLESVEALLNAASETLEGLRRETRAGLEYALQTHKTVDIQMDLNAPVIIIPEDVTTNNCNHLIIDAGHIAIESHLVPKEAIMTIHQKRNMKYTDEDFRNLESLMYDKLSLRLEDAQFIIGDNLQACREALVLHTNDALHILERISFDLQIEKSIVPTAVNIAQFKVSGKLPSLQVNLSDIKYKSLMRLIDVCIPHFGDEDIVESASQPTRNITNAFQLPAPLFRQNDPEYNIEDDDDDDNDSEQQITGNMPASQEEQFFEADDGSFVRPELRQHIFEVDFQVDRLRAVISKSTPDGTDKLLGDLHLDGFSLSFALAKYHMKVDVNLSSVAMSVIQPGEKEMQFISTPEFGSSNSQNLLKVAYTRVQKESPDFLTLYEGVNQSVDIKVTTLVFHAAPEPVLALYDFIMSTFVAGSSQVDSSSEMPLHNDQTALETAPSDGSSKIRVLLKLEGVQVTLINDMASLATLSLSTADISVFIRPRTIRVSGRLGNLTLINDNLKYPIVGDFEQLMSIEGKNFADFTYQTYDPEEDSYTGVKSSVHLDAASIKFHFIEQPLHDLYLFISKLAKLKGLYDAATQVAVQRASEIERMQFEISIKSPIVILPSDPTSSSDALILRLGQIGAHNVSEPLVNRISASLRGIQLVSTLRRNGEDLTLKMIDDIDVSADIIQTSAINRTQDTDYPDTQIAVKVSDIRLHLTQVQYCLLFKLANAIPRVFAGIPDDETGGAGNPIVSEPVKNVTATDVDFQPELRSLSQRNWTSLDLVVSVNTIKLHLYDHLALSEQQLKDHGIARFALNDNTLRCKILSNGAGEAQVVLRSFTMSNTRPGQTKFREIIPAAQHNRNQFMLLYTMSSGQGPSLAVLTVDSPQIIFAVDPVISLLEFFTSAFSGNQQQPSAELSTGTVHENQTAEQQGSLDFRIDLHDVSISVLENDEDAESRAIRLYISHILLSQQGIFALTVSRLGMSLMKMGRATESVRFLDDVDLTVSLDNRSSTSHQMMNIEISAKPIVFRASYRDINMITSIVNRAIERYGNSQQTLEQQKGSDKSLERVGSDSGYHGTDIGTSSVRAKSHPQSIGRARVLISTEQLKVSSDGFRLVLIGDLHEQPMLHLKVKPFILGAKDWSGELHSTMTVTTAITYWNLTNSHWEPLIDPWTLTISVTRETPTGGIDLTLLARERLDLNISTTFMELALTTLNTWSREGQFVLQKSRGIYAPYRIRNQTGAPIFIWSDTDSTSNTKAIDAVKVLQSQSIDWRFDDWKTMREHVSSGQHNIGVQFTEESWEQLRGIPVDREGEYVFSLRPRHAKYPDRLLCEVKVVDNTKIVTLRSTYKVENLTLYPMELMLVDDLGHPVYSLEKIVPGQEYSLPIEAVMKNRIRLQPDQGFGYKWSHPIRWEDLISKKSFTVKCPHADPKEAAFRLQAWAQTDTMENSTSKYPKINLKLRAPLELENLLPYNLEYRIYDKNTNQNWKSYLRKGGVMPVHSVELGHFILLNINVQETVFKPSEFTIINTDGHSDFDIEHSLTLRDQLDRTLDLKLNYVRHPESGGAFKVQIYSPYIVINKTGIPFSVKSSKAARTGSRESAGDTSVDALSTSNPFLLSHSNKQGHEFTFQVADSSWSQPISFEAPAAETAMVVASQKHKGDEYHLGLSWSEGIGKYKLTKVITITPRFLIKNGLSQNIAFREHGVAPRDRSSIEPGQRRAFYLLRAGNEKLLTVAYPGLNAQWSPPINMEDIGSVHFRLPRSGQTKAYDLVRADVRIEASTIFIFLKAATDDWPFIIENSSDYPFDLFQQDEGRDIKNGDKSMVYALQSHTSMSYAWDYPAARDKKLIISIGAARRVIDILEIGNLIPFKFNYQQRNKAVSLDVRADGQKQILRITNYNPDRSLYRPRPQRTTSVSISRQDTISSSVEGFEAVPEEITTNLAILIDLAGIGVSLINKRMVEVIYSVMDGIKLEYTNSRVAQSLNIAIGTLQVDNQLHEAIFPVILQPTPVPKEASGIAALPTIQASVIWLKDQEHGVLFIKYCSILLQALTIEVDEDLLFALYDLIQIKGASWEEGTTDVLIVHPHDIAEPSLDSTGQDLYFEVLELQPIKLSLSFMRTERVNSEEKLSIKNPLAVVVNALTMTVGNINDAPLEMNALAIKDMRLTLPELQSRIAYHYRQDILRQLYRILGSADFIGNPVGLFTNVSSGVADIFYEPFQGVVVHGNKELGIGIAKGAASFVKKTVFGVSDSVTKFTSSVGKGLSAATFDSEYQARRRMTQRRNKPRHAIYGVTAGGEAFASSVTSAMEGVFMKPIEGAESEGAFGFFKGVGKGLVGAVTKPVVGVFDLASNVSEGIRNTTTVFDNPDRDRVRQPRLVPADGVLRPYSAREALGQSWMKDINNGAYRREHYVAHINSPGGDNVVLLTDSRVLSLWSKKLRLDWELPFTQIQGVTVEDTGIRFAHKSGREQDKFAFIPDKAAQSWFFNQVASVVKAFNSRRRMDS